MEGQDFIASELLSELRDSGVRKDQQIHRLQKIVIINFLSTLITIMVTIGAFLWYLNQYDFSSESSTSTTYSTEGVYAIVDSEGNIISQDVSSEELTEILEVINNGEVNEKSYNDTDNTQNAQDLSKY